MVRVVVLLAVALSCLSTSLVRAEEIVPLSDSRYGCLQDEYGTALVRIWLDGDYAYIRFARLIRPTRRAVKRLQLRLARYQRWEFDPEMISRVQDKLNAKNTLLQELLDCRAGNLPDDPDETPTPTPTATPTSSPSSDLENPCQVVGNRNRISLRIINGDTCSVGNSPVVELYLYEGARLVGLCSGTAISERAVLTAAHCLNEGITGVKVITESGQFTATAFHYRPEYDYDDSEKNDIGVVLTGSDLPIRTAGLLSGAPAAGEKGIIAGYGLDEDGGSEVLKAGIMTIAEASSSGIVAYFDGSDSNTCSGDSGGPILVYRSGAWVIAGTTSWGTKENCTAGDESHFSNISTTANRNFIESYVPGLE